MQGLQFSGIKPDNGWNCSGSIEANTTGMTGVLVGKVVATKVENDASVSATELLLPVCFCTLCKSLFKSRMSLLLEKSWVEFIFPLSSKASCCAKRPSSSAAQLVSDSSLDKVPMSGRVHYHAPILFFNDAM